jgi:hypothetical protein
MNDSTPTRHIPDSEVLTVTGATSPLVFISHDTRDADLTEALSKLLKSVSAGMIKTFRSSDKKPGEEIDFGEEWYKRLMERLQSTSDVICLFTERSLDRPWLLFEAGVAKGKLNTPVVGIALGVRLDRVTTGPFYQFQNMDDSEQDLIKLVHQLARRIPSLELDEDVVRDQVKAFKNSEDTILKRLAGAPKKKAEGEDPEDSPFAKVMEEMKTLPTRVAERLAESGDPMRRRRARRFNPMMIDELMVMTGKSDDPLAILMAASLFREDIPWLYELGMEVYRAAKTGNPDIIEAEMKRLQRFSKLIMMQGPLMDGLGIFDNKETYMFAHEFPMMLETSLKLVLSSTSSGRNRAAMKLEDDPRLDA